VTIRASRVLGCWGRQLGLFRVFGCALRRTDTRPAETRPFRVSGKPRCDDGAIAPFPPLRRAGCHFGAAADAPRDPHSPRVRCRSGDAASRKARRGPHEALQPGQQGCSSSERPLPTHERRVSVRRSHGILMCARWILRAWKPPWPGQPRPARAPATRTCPCDRRRATLAGNRHSRRLTGEPCVAPCSGARCPARQSSLCPQRSFGSRARSRGSRPPRTGGPGLYESARAPPSRRRNCSTLAKERPVLQLPAIGRPDSLPLRDRTPRTGPLFPAFARRCTHARHRSLATGWPSPPCSPRGITP